MQSHMLECTLRVPDTHTHAITLTYQGQTLAMKAAKQMNSAVKMQAPRLKRGYSQQLIGEEVRENGN
eukprot:4418050-Amphidinium_carterae.1